MKVEGKTPSALTFSRLLGEGPMARVALEASLEGLGAPAFIVSEQATILHANQAGLARGRESKGETLHTELVAALASRGDPAIGAAALVTRLQCADGPPYYLVVFRRSSSSAETVAYVSQLWELTPRQSEVLGLLLEGFSNKTIGVRLGCTERTVEAHLTAIFQKSGFDGRSVLMAALARR